MGDPRPVPPSTARAAVTGVLGITKRMPPEDYNSFLEWAANSACAPKLDKLLGQAELEQVGSKSEKIDRLYTAFIEGTLGVE